MRERTVGLVVLYKIKISMGTTTVASLSSSSVVVDIGAPDSPGSSRRGEFLRFHGTRSPTVHIRGNEAVK
jgi:hypothetical protein